MARNRCTALALQSLWYSSERICTGRLSRERYHSFLYYLDNLDSVPGHVCPLTILLLIVALEQHDTAHHAHTHTHTHHTYTYRYTWLCFYTLVHCVITLCVLTMCTNANVSNTN